ncbi:hypothetical protein Tco_0832652, partial [Tanacetum coccineum]
TNVDFADLIWEEFKYQIASRLVSKQKQELMPLLRFTKLIVKFILSQNDQIYKRPISFHQVIKLDPTLGNLKFPNKGTKDPMFGMAILAVMLNDNIKSSAEYSKYLAKSKGSAPVKATSRGKGLLSKKGVEIAIERVSIPKRRRSKTVVEEVGKSKKVAKDVDSEETDEEPPVRRRPSGVVIGEGYGVTLEFHDELTLKSSNEGAGVTPEVPDESSDHSSSSNSDLEFVVEDISSDEANVTKNADEAKKADIEKETEEQVAEEHVAEKHAGEKNMFTSQFLNDNTKVTLNEVLKDPVEPEVQSMMDVPVTQVKPAK